MRNSTRVAAIVLGITFIMGGGVAGGQTPKWLHISLTVASLLLYCRAYWIELNAMMQNAALMEKHLSD